MKIEDQVCSLEQAKRLKELGVKQDSFFYFEVFTGLIVTGGDFMGDPISSAFTVGELGVMLGVGRPCVFTGEFWITEGSFGVGIGIIGKTEAECRASLLIAIIESNGDKVQEVNARLSA